MLKRFLPFLAAVMLCRLALSSASAEGTDPSQIVHLHGRAVLAVNTIFRNLLGQHEITDSATDLSKTTIFVTDANSSVAVSIVQNGVRHAYSFKTTDQSIRADSNPPADMDAITLSGSATKALITAYSSWLQGAVLKIASDSDVRSGAFETTIFQSHSGRTGAPGFIVSYAPSPTHYVGLTNCNVFRNTFVFSGTWATILEPFIC